MGLQKHGFDEREKKVSVMEARLYLDEPHPHLWAWITTAKEATWTDFYVQGVCPFCEHITDSGYLKMKAGETCGVRCWKCDKFFARIFMTSMELRSVQIGNVAMELGEILRLYGIDFYDSDGIFNWNELERDLR